MPIRVGMVSLGCSKNQVDAERMLYKINEKGYELVGDAALADVAIINTCGFIESAKQEAIETILEFAELKKEGRIKKIIITGCLAERYKDEVASEIPEADAVVGIGCNDKICDVIEKVLEGDHFTAFDSKLNLGLTGGRIQTTLSFYSYLKMRRLKTIYVLLRYSSIRGRNRRSHGRFWRRLPGLGQRRKRAYSHCSGYHRYGEDIYGKPSLPELLEKLCTIPQLKWIRVLYCYPERISDELLDVMAREDKIVKYIDMPIQHCDADILKKMNRPGDEETLRALIKKIREKVPGIILRTTLITGFPTETVEQFDRLADFVRDMEFDRLGCFPYSAEEGTKAAKMDGQRDEETKQHRADIIMEQQMMIMGAKNQLLRDTVIETLVEGYDRYGECYFGRSAADAPEIDGKIFFNSKKRKLVPGMFVHVHINEVMDYDLIGDVVDESAQ
ncbi:MAG: 30S ribosomal protein S12 methylthiotransferase RimO [Clostridia bacterium]